MVGRESVEAPGAVGQPLFATTHWSVVLAAKDQKSPAAAAALEQLCRTYWYPLYAYVRRRGYGHEDAEDYTQGLLAQLLERHSFARADRAKGRFRSFLLGAMDYFLADELAKVHAKKRGGGLRLVPLDGQSAQERYRLEPAELVDPGKLFERRWAMTLLERVLERLEAEFASETRGPVFERLRDFLLGDGDSVTYEEAGRALGMTKGAVKVAVHRLRRRYRELFREEIAQTVGDPVEVEEEIRHVFAVLSY